MIQNNDITLRITVTDDGGTPFTISALNALEFYVYRNENNKKILIATFKSTNTGIYGITTITDNAGVVEIVLGREKTREIPANAKIYVETRLQLSASAEYKDSLENLGGAGVEIDLSQSSANPDSLR